MRTPKRVSEARKDAQMAVKNLARTATNLAEILASADMAASAPVDLWVQWQWEDATIAVHLVRAYLELR